MPPQYELAVLAHDHTVYRGKVTGLVAPGWDGYLGVLAHHAPMLAELAMGELTVVDEGGARLSFAVSGGYLEVGRDGVMALVDAGESAEEIDVGRAYAAEERAQRRLRSRDSKVDAARAQAALRRALNRLRIAEKRLR